MRYPFSDHNAPQFEQILALCEDVMHFLNQHPDNIVAINCKAGKVSTRQNGSTYSLRLVYVSVCYRSRDLCAPFNALSADIASTPLAYAHTHTRTFRASCGSRLLC